MSNPILLHCGECNHNWTLCETPCTTDELMAAYKDHGKSCPNCESDKVYMGAATKPMKQVDKKPTEFCAGCDLPATRNCHVDCGMSLCGAPLCDNCRHVDKDYGWSHEMRTDRHPSTTIGE